MPLWLIAQCNPKPLLADVHVLLTLTHLACMATSQSRDVHMHLQHYSEPLSHATAALDRV